MMGRVAVIGAVVAALGWSAAVVAQNGEGEAVVKDRQAAMKQQGTDLNNIKKFLDGSVDQADAVKAAGELVTIGQALPNRFPKGTSSAEMPGKTRAKPAIWAEWDKFLAAQKNYVAEVQKLEAALKGGDKTAIQAQWTSVAKNGCGGCHGPFREPAS
ncbi:MAG TPA: cytochrome c [Stellaceae bacterium]|nr:cytochrome c [Stellaceae bacterium]